MFRFFRKNYLYSNTIEPHCAYCSHCTKDNEHQGVCDLRGIVALAGQCRKFQYNPLMRVPPKPARIRGRFSDEDFFFEERKASDEDAAAESLNENPADAAAEPDEPMEQKTQPDSAETTEENKKEESM